MKGKAISLVMIVALLASTVMITGVYGWGYTPGDDTKFNIKLPNGMIFMNTSAYGGHPNVGEKFNITVEIQNVDSMTAFGFSVMWNSTFNQMTGNYWMSPAMKAELLAGRWGAASLASWSNDTVPLIVPNVGSFLGYGQTALSPNTLTGTYDLVIIEFQCMAFGPSGFYIWKTNPGYGYEEQYKALGWVPSSWLNATTPMGQSEPYDVYWVPTYENVTNALLWQHPPPYAPTAVKTHDPAFPFANENVTVTVTQTAAGFNGTALNDITTVTIEWGHATPTSTIVGSSPFVFTHNYTADGTYTLEAYCWAPNQPPGKEWCNLTNPITVLPPCYYSPYITDKVIDPAFPLVVCDNVIISWTCNPGCDGDNLCPCVDSGLCLNLPGGAVLCPPVTKIPVGLDLQCSSTFHVNESGVWHIKIWCFAPGIPPFIYPGYTEYVEDICQTFEVRPPVGGICIPIDKPAFPTSYIIELIPYIGLASTILVATAATAIYFKRVKRRKEKQ